MSDKTEHKCECAQAYQDIDRVIQKNKGNKGALVQVLHYVQERLGYVPKDVQVRIAETLGVSLSEVYGVVTFYSLFRERPRGKYIISSCQGTACYVRGAPEVLERFERELGVSAGESTDDNMFTVEVVRCIGACGLAPVVTVNSDTYGRVNPDQVPDILDLYRKKSAESADVAGI